MHTRSDNGMDCAYCEQSWAHATTVTTICRQFKANKLSNVTLPLKIKSKVHFEFAGPHFSDFSVSQKLQYTVFCHIVAFLSHDLTIVKCLALIMSSDSHLSLNAEFAVSFNC